MRYTAVGEQHLECTNETLITITLLLADIAGYGRCYGETH
jgi:hypothetical protein